MAFDDILDEFPILSVEVSVEVVVEEVVSLERLKAVLKVLLSLYRGVQLLG